jgi:hypothetical protein
LREAQHQLNRLSTLTSRVLLLLAGLLLPTTLLTRLLIGVLALLTGILLPGILLAGVLVLTAHSGSPCLNVFRTSRGST